MDLRQSRPSFDYKSSMWPPAGMMIVMVMIVVRARNYNYNYNLCGARQIFEKYNYCRQHF